jgi:hypothetical protein
LVVESVAVRERAVPPGGPTLNLKTMLSEQGMKLMQDPRVMKVMQDPRVMKVMMQAVQMRGKLQEGFDERVDDVARSLNLVTKKELRELKREMRKMERELERAKAANEKR